MRVAVTFFHEEYIRRFGGPVTQQTYTAVEEERARLEAPTGQAATMAEANFQALAEIDMQLAVLEQRDQPHTLYLMDERGFLKLFQVRSDTLYVLLQAVFVSMVCTPVFAQKHKKRTLLITTPLGGSALHRRKLCLCAIYGIVITAAIFSAQYLLVNKYYLLGHWNAPAASLLTLGGHMPPISVGQYMAALMALRLVGIIPVIAACAALGVWGGQWAAREGRGRLARRKKGAQGARHLTFPLCSFLFPSG